MKSIKILLTTCFLLLILTVKGQEEINSADIPKNTIAATPYFQLIGENGYVFYYKRLIKAKPNKLRQLRIGFDLYSSFKKDNQTGSATKLFLGIENLKKIGKFSLSYGPEISGAYNIASGRHIEPVPNTIFSQNNTSAGNNNDIEKGSYFMISGIGFIGLKYNISKHFSIGYESAMGVAYFKSTDKMITDEKESTNGILMDIDPARFFTIEFSF